MADIEFYNQLTAHKEKFQSLNDKKVGLYTCGPTVYDFVHVGNLRTYLFEDILRRVLEYNDFIVTQVMNLTDIEDKIIRKMKETGQSLEEITTPFSEAFFHDLEKLNIQKAQQYPKATSHINEMIKIISSLLDKGVAYQKDGSVYFSLEKFPEYGKLSKLEKRAIKVGARVNVDEYQKDNAEDFVLWKATTRDEPFWDAPFGKGRPGWHIECSAMSMKYLGENFDIHAGAVDLIFPHHENEIAQSEAYTGKKFVNYWLEAEHLLINNQKMAKSLGNIFTLTDLIKKNLDPLAFRYLILITHYRSKLNFTWDSVQAAENALNNMREIASSLPVPAVGSKDHEEKFLKAINDDLDTPRAMALVWDLLKSDLEPKVKAGSLVKFNRVLGLGLDKLLGEELPDEIKDLIAQRDRLRAEKNFIESDNVRDRIIKSGYDIKDSDQGTIVSKKFS